MRILEHITGLVARSTGLILLLVIVLTILATTRIFDPATGQWLLEIDPSANRLLSDDDPAVQFYDRARRTFGNDETLVIALTAKDIFTPDIFARIDRITRRIAEVESVHHVVSPTNALDIRSTEDGLEVTPFYDSMATDPAAIDALRNRIMDNPVYAGSLVSGNGDTAAVIVYFQDIPDREFIQRGILDRVIRIVEEEKGDLEVWFTGAPYFKASIVSALIHDLVWMPPMIILVLSCVLALSFRNLLGVIVPLLTVLASVIITMGIISTLGYSLSMISALVPPLLMILGISYSVHVVSEYFQNRSGKLATDDLLTRTLGQVLLPVVLTGLTTIAGFIALMVNPIKAVQEFGILSAIGVVVITFLSVTFTPALLKFLDRGATTTSKLAIHAASMYNRLVDRIALWVLRYRKFIFIVSGVLFALALYGITRIQVNADFITSFPPDSEVRASFYTVNEKLGGAQPFYIVIEGSHRDTFKEPHNLRALEKLQEWLAEQPEIGGSASIADYLKLVNKALHDNDPAFYAIPDNRRMITQLLFLSSNDELERIVDSRYQTTSMLVRSRVVDSVDIAALVDRINHRLAQLPQHLKATVTGNPVLITETLSTIIVGQARSVGMALLIVYVILSLMFMSQRVGFIALIPNIIPIAIYFGSLGFFGISLNPSTSLIAPMVLGIAIDDTIHYFARFNWGIRRFANDRKATIIALKTVGRPVTYTSIGLCLGFLVLMTSELRMQVEVGIMAAWALAIAWLCDFFLTPALCVSVRITTLWDVLTLDLGSKPQESIPLLNGLRNSQARIVALMSRIVRVPAGKRLITAGEKGSEMYVVIDGKLQTSFEGEHGRVQLATQSRGDVVGEAGLFYKERTADVDTLEDSRLLCLTQENLERLSRRYPYIATKVFRNLNRVLAARLFTTTHRLGQ